MDRSVGLPERGAQPPVVVIGAGAAGLMAAIHAATPLRAGSADAGRVPGVLLLERTNTGGKKILMSGGGRCNVLPSTLDPARYVTASSPNTLKKLLLSWPLAEQRRFFEEELGVRLALESETGKLFPVTNSARDVLQALRGRVESLGGSIRFDALVTDLEPARDGSWVVRLAGGGTIPARCVILATGGLSVPATGSDGTGLDIVRRLGHTVHDTYPALTPLTARPHRYAALAGVSLTVTLEAPTARRKHVVRGGFLFTHKGCSGPAVLDLSHLAVLSRRARGPRQPIFVQWTDLDAGAWDRLLREGDAGVPALLRRHLPARLAEALLEDAGVAPAARTSQLTRDARRRLVEALTHHPLPWTGDEGYRKAEVTGGGVALGEVDPGTLESRLHPGLFLCGEILDAFGPIGGYNFAWAWATGRAAGLGAAGPAPRRTSAVDIGDRRAHSHGPTRRRPEGNDMSTTLILGGGFGGIACARALRAKLPPSHQVTLVDRDETFTVGAAKPWVMLGERPARQASQRRAALLPDGVELLRSDVLSIDPRTRDVRTSTGALAADHLVIALGAERDMAAVPGLAAAAQQFYSLDGAVRLREALAAFAGGRLVLLIPRLPFSCPPGPYEGIIMIHAALSERGLRAKTQIEVHTVEKSPMGTAGPEMGKAIVGLLAERAIGFHPLRKAVSVDGAAKSVRFEDGSEAAYDLLIAIPPHRVPRVAVEAGLAEAGGWIPVDPATFEVKAPGVAPHVYAVGDVTTVPLPGRWDPAVPLALPKAGIFAAAQGETVAGRIVAAVAGGAPGPAFDAKGHCFIEVGAQQAIRAEGDFFATPHPVMGAQPPGGAQYRDKVAWVEGLLKEVR